MKLATTVLISVILVVMLPQAHADPIPAYVGAAFGGVHTGHNSSPGNASFDTSDDTHKILVGVSPLDWFSVEMAYMDLGRIEQTSIDCCDLASYSTDQTALGVVGKFLLRTKLVDLSMKVGIAHWKLDGFTEGGLSPMRRDVAFNGDDALFGLGIEKRLGKFGIRADYDLVDYKGIDVPQASPASASFETPRLLTVGMTWQFH